MYTHIQMYAEHNDAIKTSGHSSWEKYTSHFIERGRKGYEGYYCVWEGVGDWTELQHIDPHSHGHNSVSFPFSRAAQPEAWGPSLSGTWSSFQHLLSNWPELTVAGVIYNNLMPTYFLWASQFHTQFNPSTVKAAPDLLISSTGCTCYLNRCISSFNSLAGLKANMQQDDFKFTLTQSASISY